MKTSTAYPPNYRDIIAALPEADTSTPIFCYGDTIYNPHKRELTKDLIEHESVHARQQGPHPEVWWYNFLRDPAFRLSQEIEAYGAQFALVRPHIHGKLRQWALDSMSAALSGPTYGNLISQAEAAAKIRNYTPV